MSFPNDGMRFQENEQRFAIAAGNVVYRPFPKVEGKDWTSGVWAEPELIDAAYWEFSADTGR